jgi:hypothetical protein
MALPQPQLQPPAVDPGALSASITASMSARRLVVSARTYLGCCTLVFCGKKAKRTWHSQMNVSSPPPPLSPTQSLSDHTTNVPISFPVNMCVCVCMVKFSLHCIVVLPSSLPFGYSAPYSLQVQRRVHQRTASRPVLTPLLTGPCFSSSYSFICFACLLILLLDAGLLFFSTRVA